MEEQVQENSIKRRIKSTIITVLLILAVLLCLYVAVQVMSTGHANIFGFSLFRVVTGSMEPTISVGSLLISQQTDIASIAENDIVCFYSKDSELLGKVITHRVIRVLEDAGGAVLLETKGDANAVADYQYVTADNLIGKVIYYAGEGNMLSEILSFFSTKIGFFGCIVFPCMILTGVILKDCVKNIRGEMQRMVEEINEEEAKQEMLAAAQMTEEEYAQLTEKIRAELIEELKQGAQGQQDN